MSPRDTSAAREHEHKVDEELCKFRVAKKSKAVWRAWGSFRKEVIDVTASSESSVIQRWIDRANYLADE